MKKSKVIIPALGVLILSTAASVTGTVAWFTANRTATITFGEFAVVKTTNDLSVTLGTGVGTGVDNVAHSVTTTGGYKLTDSSFDHTETSAPILPIIAPNIPRDKVLKKTALAAASAGELERGTNIYSAFTWTMQFTVSFSEGATKKQGLYIDLHSAETYMHEKVSFAKDYVYQEKDAGTYYSNPALTGDTTVISAGGTADAAKTLYKAAPDATGKAFRIAFVPTTVPSGSMGYTKVWAENEGSAEGSGKFVDGVALNGALTATAYGTETTSYNGSAYSTASAAGVLMTSADDLAIPDDSLKNSSTALSSDKNYLGYFAAASGANVSMTFTCVAWYDGTHPEIVGSATNFETIVASATFGVTELTD